MNCLFNDVFLFNLNNYHRGIPLRKTDEYKFYSGLLLLSLNKDIINYKRKSL